MELHKQNCLVIIFAVNCQCLYGTLSNGLTNFLCFLETCLSCYVFEISVLFGQDKFQTVSDGAIWIVPNQQTMGWNHSG